jgi:superfamily II DNA or RNA helicase
VTATPIRLDGTGLGEVFDHMIEGLDTATLIKMGYLSQFEIYAPKNIPDLSNVNKRLGEYKNNELTNAMNKPTITGDAEKVAEKLINKMIILVEENKGSGSGILKARKEKTVCDIVYLLSKYKLR